MSQYVQSAFPQNVGMQHGLVLETRMRVRMCLRTCRHSSYPTRLGILLPWPFDRAITFASRAISVDTSSGAPKPLPFASCDSKASRHRRRARARASACACARARTSTHMQGSLVHNEADIKYGSCPLQSRRRARVTSHATRCAAMQPCTHTAGVSSCRSTLLPTSARLCEWITLAQRIITTQGVCQTSFPQEVPIYTYTYIYIYTYTPTPSRRTPSPMPSWRIAHPRTHLYIYIYVCMYVYICI